VVNKATIMIAVVLGSAATQASNWVQVGTGKDGTKVLVDTSSITVNGPVRQAWLKMVFPTHTQKGFGENADKWLDYNLNHSAFHCGEGKSRSDELIDNFDDGTNRKVPAEELSGDQWESVPPNTALETAMKVVCGWR
jgi:hypothetical protein